MSWQTNSAQFWEVRSQQHHQLPTHYAEQHTSSLRSVCSEKRIMTIDLPNLNLTAHTQAGGMCLTATCSTKQLMKDGAPLRATARLKRAKCGKKTRPDMLYANEQREKFKAEWAKEFFRQYSESSLTVSYTHLTLPTILLV